MLSFLRRRPIGSGLSAHIRNLPRDSWHRVTFNGTPVTLPAYTLRLYAGCASGRPEGMRFIVEHAHSVRMLAQLSPGTLFLDIGASSGAMSLPFGILHPEISI